jgi:hypothetical protein
MYGMTDKVIKVNVDEQEAHQHTRSTPGAHQHTKNTPAYQEHTRSTPAHQHTMSTPRVHQEQPVECQRKLKIMLLLLKINALLKYTKI